jgi:hypothetical protein
MTVTDLPSFHYHTHEALRRNTWLAQLASSLAREHKEIGDTLREEPDWTFLVS